MLKRRRGLQRRQEVRSGQSRLCGIDCCRVAASSCDKYAHIHASHVVVVALTHATLRLREFTLLYQTVKSRFSSLWSVTLLEKDPVNLSNATSPKRLQCPSEPLSHECVYVPRLLAKRGTIGAPAQVDLPGAPARAALACQQKLPQQELGYLRQCGSPWQVWHCPRLPSWPTPGFWYTEDLALFAVRQRCCQNDRMVCLQGPSSLNSQPPGH